MIVRPSRGGEAPLGCSEGCRLAVLITGLGPCRKGGSAVGVLPGAGLSWRGRGALVPPAVFRTSPSRRLLPSTALRVRPPPSSAAIQLALKPLPQSFYRSSTLSSVQVTLVSAIGPPQSESSSFTSRHFPVCVGRLVLTQGSLHDGSRAAGRAHKRAYSSTASAVPLKVLCGLLASDDTWTGWVSFPICSL